jgi:thiamine monophosphate synthase
MADGIAVVTAIMKSDNPQEAARKLKTLVMENFTKGK